MSEESSGTSKFASRELLMMLTRRALSVRTLAAVAMISTSMFIVELEPTFAEKSLP